MMTEQEKPKLRLFVFEDFCPDWTSGLAFAIAKDETDARKLIAKQHGYEPYNWGTMKSYPLTRRIAKSVAGGG